MDMPKFKKKLLQGALLTLSMAAATSASAEDRFWSIPGEPATGPNDLCGEPKWGLPAPLPTTAHFAVIGAFDSTPGATEALPLTPEICASDALMATYINPGFMAFFGFPDPNPLLLNLPLRDIPVGNGLDGVMGPLPEVGDFPANALPPVRSEPNEPITTSGWLGAGGSMDLTCFEDGTSSVVMYFRNLIPNGVYSVFGIWKTVLPGTDQIGFLPVAFGGYPNAVVSSLYGTASFRRKLDYCPKDITPDGSQLMFVDLAYHADGVLQGGFPFSPLGNTQYRTADGVEFESTQPPGVATFVQMGFPVTVEPLN